MRSNYLWILLIQTLAYVGKLTVHPTPVRDFATFVTRADIGPLPGGVVLTMGVLYCLSGVSLVIWVSRKDALRHSGHDGASGTFG